MNVRSYESELLTESECLISAFSESYGARCSEARFQLLEAVASRFGGFPLETFQQAFGILPVATVEELVERARPVVEAIEVCGIAPALALSALARDKIDISVQRSSGAYHTDFRLAERLAKLVVPKPGLKSRVVDPACGAGILLVALSIHVCGRDRRKMARWLSDCVFAADLSANALRGALLALASLTNEIASLVKMRSRWRIGDSLIGATENWLPNGERFDVVIANPPWERVKLSRHEFLKSNGHERHYGAETKIEHLDGYLNRQAKVALYADELGRRYPLMSQGEPDLYVAFTELFDRLCRSGGTISALVPGGLIRSQGTEALRRHLLSISCRLSFSVIENRARFFGIDTRFKFLALTCVKKGARFSPENPVILRHERGTPEGLEKFAEVRIGRRSLRELRPDLSVPEVRSHFEWRMFRQVVANGEQWSDAVSEWHPAFCREVDMTKERPKFLSTERGASIPLIEGRMVQQHRFGAKEYLSGSGRRAVWRTLPFGAAHVVPQFYISEFDIPTSARPRTKLIRAGFCDITGQTNERSMMAAIIPPGVVCGNKVPTVLFANDPSEDRLLVWCAIVNSLPFDWLARRIITTTINYFLLLSLPLPRLVRDGLPWRRLAAAAAELRDLDAAGNVRSNLMRAAELRALIDVEVAIAYGLKFDELTTMLADFPLLDRGQPALPGEEKSTITRDLLLLSAGRRLRKNVQLLTNRVRKAQYLGAIAYVPSEARDEAIDELGRANVR